jgi:transcription antitermination factor NusA-like protein
VAENEVTLGEVYRAIVEVRQEQRDMRKDLIGRAEYESDQEGIAHKFQESGKVHVQLEAKVAAEGADRKVAVTSEATEREKADARIEARLDRIGALVKWGGGISVTIILTVVGWIIVSGVGP